MEQRKFSIADQMVVCLAREIQNGDSVFHGVSSHLPMVATMLARSLHAPAAVHLNIPGGVNPQMGVQNKYSSAGLTLCQQASGYFPLADVFDLSMRGKLDVAFLSGVQFDVKGHVNASVIGDYDRPKVRLPGGAGSAVLIPTARRAIIWRSKHDRRTFVEQVDFVTTHGNIYHIVTPLCIFAFRDGRLVVESIHRSSSLAEVQENTGFQLVGNLTAITPEPTSQELSMLKKIDPLNTRSIEFEKM